MENFKDCPLFAGMEEAELTALLDCLGARTCRADRGQMLFREGDPARYVGIVLSGAVQIQQEDYDGGRIILARVGPGELFGESFACAGTESLPVSAAAAAESRVLLLDCRRMLAPCGRACPCHSRLVQNLTQIMARKNLAFQRKLQILSHRTTREKLLAYLSDQARQQGSRRFEIPFDRQELADYLGVDRSGLSAEIGRLRAEGVLESRRHQFELL